MIHRTELIEINELLNILKNAVMQMEKKGIFQWDEIYPDEKTLLNDIAKGDMYSYRIENKTAGYIVLNEEDSPEYSDIEWSTDSEKILYVHRLCIHPAYQGRGIAKDLMLFAEEFGRKNDFKAIRLDAFINNQAAVNLYSNLGYRNAGIISLRKGEFYCFEKKLYIDQIKIFF